MDVTAMGQAGLTGWRRRLGDTVARPVSNRTTLSEDQVKALIGAIFLALTLYQFLKTVRHVLKAGREGTGAAA